VRVILLVEYWRWYACGAGCRESQRATVRVVRIVGGEVRAVVLEFDDGEEIDGEFLVDDLVVVQSEREHEATRLPRWGRAAQDHQRADGGFLGRPCQYSGCRLKCITASTSTRSGLTVYTMA
jgi:hypothetical protein